METNNDQVADLPARVERLELTIAAMQDASLNHLRLIETLRRYGARTAVTLMKLRSKVDQLEAAVDDVVKLKRDVVDARGIIDVAAEDVAQLRQETRPARDLATSIAGQLAAMPCDVRVTVSVQLADGITVPIASAEDVDRARRLALELQARRAHSRPGSRGHSSGKDRR